MEKQVLAVSYSLVAPILGWGCGKGIGIEGIVSGGRVWGGLGWVGCWCRRGFYFWGGGGDWALRYNSTKF